MKKGLKRMDDKAFILSKKFRTAIERAKREGEFDSDPTFKSFPKAAVVLQALYWRNFCMKMVYTLMK